MIDRLVAQTAVEKVQVEGVLRLSWWRRVFEATKGTAAVRAVQSGMCEPSERSLAVPLLIWDLVRGNAASVAGPDAADVGESEEACDTCQTHTGAVQVHLSQVHVFQELQTWAKKSMKTQWGWLFRQEIGDITLWADRWSKTSECSVWSLPWSVILVRLRLSFTSWLQRARPLRTTLSPTWVLANPNT